MALDLSAASLIRAGSGLTYVAVGLLVYTLGRRSPMGSPLTLFCVAFGLGFIVINPLAADPALLRIGLAVEGACFLVASAALVWLHLRAPWRQRVHLWTQAAALGSCLAMAAVIQVASGTPEYLISYQLGLYNDPVPAQLLNLSSNVLVAVAAFVTMVAGLAARRGDAVVRGRGLLAVGLLGYFAYSNGSVMGAGGAGRLEALTFGVELALVLIAAMTWVSGSRVATWGLLVLALVSALVHAAGIDFAGDVGIVRILAAVAVAVAVLRYDLLGVALPKLAVRRGTIATGALAALFIVAQIAQNFLSASYGLVMGGIVAGAFLFAAQPIQRAFEGRGQGQAQEQGPIPARAERAAENERVYKVALRRFYADDTITQDEEVALAHLADELGLTTRRATELRIEVEREWEAR